MRTIALALCLAVASAAQAGPPTAMSSADRAAATRRPVAVSVSPQIGISVDVGRVMSDTAYGGGLIGAIMLSSMDDKRETMTANASAAAQATIAPLLAAMKDQDFTGLALQTSRNALARVDGFDPAAISLVPGPDASTTQALVAAFPSGQVGLLSFRTQMSPDFTHLQLVADIAIARTNGMVPVYAQRVVSVVELKQRSYDHKENVARWSHDDARLAREAITAAYHRLEKIIPVVFNLDPARYAVVTSKTKTGSAFAAGFYGPLLLRDDLGPVIWSKGNGFIAFQPAGD